MNRSDLKVALLEKGAQHPVIHLHTHGVVAQVKYPGSANFKLPHVACVSRSGVIILTCYRIVIFLITIRNI
jgi:hypothetical protein